MTWCEEKRSAKTFGINLTREKSPNNQTLWHHQYSTEELEEIAALSSQMSCTSQSLQDDCCAHSIVKEHNDDSSDQLIAVINLLLLEITRLKKKLNLKETKSECSPHDNKAEDSNSNGNNYKKNSKYGLRGNDWEL